MPKTMLDQRYSRAVSATGLLLGQVVLACCLSYLNKPNNQEGSLVESGIVCRS